MTNERRFLPRDEAERINNQLANNLMKNLRQGINEHGTDSIPGRGSGYVSGIYTYPMSIDLTEIPRFAKAFGKTVKEMFDG